jgi:hypothetical protein
VRWGRRAGGGATLGRGDCARALMLWVVGRRGEWGGRAGGGAALGISIKAPS